MRLLLFISIAIFSFSACKSDGAGSKNKATYPLVWNDYSIPKYPDATLVSDKFEEEGIRQEWTVVLSTEKSFEEIRNFYVTAFEEAGWKKVKNNWNSRGEDTESLLLVYKDKGTKHSLFATKSTIRINKIRLSVVRFNS